VLRARPHRVLRGIASALALLTAASPLVGSLHEAGVRHVACPEDGELIDAPPQAPHQQPGTSTDSPAFLAERDPPAPPVSEQGHQHCAVVSQAHLRARQQSRSFVGTIPDAFTRASAVSATPRLRSVALYRLAPKASPPLV
jgi:hypothetical protein